MNGVLISSLLVLVFWYLVFGYRYAVNLVRGDVIGCGFSYWSRIVIVSIFYPLLWAIEKWII